MIDKSITYEDKKLTKKQKKKIKPAKQGGGPNYLGKQKTVTVPTKWLSDPDHVVAELAYITPREKKILIDLDLYGSLNGKPNRGPAGIQSLQGDMGGWGGGGGGGSGGSGGSGGGGGGGGGGRDYSPPSRPSTPPSKPSKPSTPPGGGGRDSGAEEKAAREKAAKEKAEKERFERERKRLAEEKTAREKAEKERFEREQKRLAEEKAAREKAAREKAEKERFEREQKRLAEEKAERERIAEKERFDREQKRLAEEKAERERIDDPITTPIDEGRTDTESQYGGDYLYDPITTPIDELVDEGRTDTESQYGGDYLYDPIPPSSSLDDIREQYGVERTKTPIDELVEVAPISEPERDTGLEEIRQRNIKKLKDLKNTKYEDIDRTTLPPYIPFGNAINAIGSVVGQFGFEKNKDFFTKNVAGKYGYGYGLEDYQRYMKDRQLGEVSAYGNPALGQNAINERAKTGGDTSEILEGLLQPVEVKQPDPIYTPKGFTYTPYSNQVVVAPGSQGLASLMGNRAFKSIIK